MPTFNQLVRKGRQSVAKKSTAPALQKGFNSLKKRPTDASSPQKRGVWKVTDRDYFILRGRLSYILIKDFQNPSSLLHPLTSDHAFLLP